MADYEFVQSDQVQQLQHELNKLKSHPLMQDSDSKELHSTMSALHESMENMLGVFKKANDEMQFEEREEKLMERHLQPVHDSIQALKEQNETLAEGVVQVSDSMATIRKTFDSMQHDMQELQADVHEILRKINELPSSHPPMHDEHIGMQAPPSTMPPPQPAMSSPMPQPNPFGSSPMPPPPSNDIPAVPKNGLAGRRKRKGISLFGK